MSGEEAMVLSHIQTAGNKGVYLIVTPFPPPTQALS